MRRLFSFVAIFCALSTFSSAMAQPRLIAFTALRMGSKMKTNGDVIDYIIASKLTDAGKQELFRKANSDFNTYKELERQWAQERFDMGLRQMAYFELLKAHYLRDLKRDEPRRYFNATENAWYKRVEDEENRVLKHLLDQRLGIVKSREQFGTWLKEQNYPHAVNESGTDVYFRWFDALKARLRIEMQMEEIQEYEIAMAVAKNRGRIDPSPTDIWNLNEKSQKLIDDHLEGQNLNQEQLDQLSATYPELLVMVKDIKRLSLASSRLEELEKYEETSASITQARNALNAALRSKGDAGILKYIDLAAQLKEKYGNAETLTQKARQSLDSFMETGDFNDYVLGRLYKMAALLESQASAQEIKLQIAQSLPNAIDEASAFEKGNTSFEDAVYQAALSKLPSDGETLAEASSLIAWVIKFEAKKIALSTKSIMHIERYEYRSSEAYDRLSNHIKMTRLQNGLKQFRERDVKDMAWRIELSNGQRYIMDDNVYPFLVN